MREGAPNALRAVAAAIVVLMLGSTGSAQAPTEGQVVLIGRFAQLRQTPEHVYGYSLELWRDGTSIVGRWSRADGQQADFPTVLIGDAQWDERNGALHFTATWCAEVETFDGVLKGDAISGSVARRWTNGRAESATVTLSRMASEGLGNMPRAQWKSRLDAAIKRLGPKC